MKLYYAAGACSLAPHIALCEVGASFELERVDFGAQRMTESGLDYYLINPKGSVPALELDSGEVLTEAAVILQYIAETNDRSDLLAKAGIERYRSLESLNFIATELHKTFGPLFAPNFPSEAKDHFREALSGKLGHLAKVLGGNSYLGGDGFGLADCYAFTVLNWCSFQHIDLSPWPSLQAYVARIAARAAVQTALPAEGFLS